MMKALLRLVMAVVFAAFLVIAVIKHLQGCSWKEAVGIAEELWNDIRNRCMKGCCCSEKESTDEEA